MKTTLLTSAFALISLSLLTACNEEEVKTVEYYQNNAEARIAKLEDCKKTGAKNDAGYIANCKNASRADFMAELDKPQRSLFENLK